MALTEEENKTIRAYNMGSFLSTYEPKLLEQIIKQNKNNAFVKVMAIAKEHREFNVNIPKKEFSKEYKNGFHNARAITEHSPQLLENLLTSDLHKDYKRGLTAGKKEYEIGLLNSKAKNQPKPVHAKYKPEFTKGFNHGYQLSQNHPDILKLSVDTQKRWSPYIEGLQAGQLQYVKDLQENKVDPKKTKPDRELSDQDYYKIRTRVEGLKENAEEKLNKLDEQEKTDNVTPPDKNTQDDIILTYLPDWMQKNPFTKDDPSPDQNLDKGKDKDIEPEL